MFATLALLVLVLPILVIGQDQCQICQSQNNAACFNETTFSICLDNQAISNYIECPKGYHCTEGSYVCYPKASTTSACVATGELSTSTSIGTMESTTATTPTSVTESSSTTLDSSPASTTVTTSTSNTKSTNLPALDSSTVSTPATTLVSHTESTQSSTLDSSPASAVTTVSTTTTAGPRDPTVMCQELQASGFYENESDPTCLTYVYCRVVDATTTTATVRSCGTGQWYDAAKRYCSTTKPDTCL